MRRLISLSLCLLICGVAIYAQNIKVSGTITSAEDGSALPGVAVTVKGESSSGTVTDINGAYTIEAPSDGILVFSYVGMETQEKEVGNSTVIDISLQGSIDLDEVVVVAYGMSREKKRLGYSLTQVGSDDLTTGSTSNFTKALSGKVAGVQVSGGVGQPGSSTNVLLRGYATVGRQTQPLYVIDGVQVTNESQNYNTNGASVNRTVDFGNGINDINSEDIESVSILRGASATALYGSQAANGVIIITTKKGSKSDVAGKPRIGISSSTIFSSPLRYPTFQSTFGQGWDGHYASDENGSWGPRFTNDQRLWGHEVDGTQLYKNFSFLEDQVKDFYTTGIMFDNTVSVSGASDNGNYYLSYNNVNSNGVVPGDKDSFNKNSLKLNASKKMGFINLTTSVNYINKETQAIPTGQGQGKASNLFDDILQHPTDISFVDMKDYQEPGSFYNPNNYFSPYLWNPYFTIDNTSNEAKVDRILGNITAEMDLIKAYNVKGIVKFGGDVQNTFGHTYDGKFVFSENATNTNQDDIPGYYREFQRNIRLYNFDAILSASQNFWGDRLEISASAGYNQFHRSRTHSEEYVKELVLHQAFPNLANGAIEPEVTDGFPYEITRRQSVFGILEAGFKNYLFLTATARNTWSSTLPKENNSYFYPAISVSFIASDAIGYLNDVSAVDMIKLRAGYGQVGNDVDPYQVLPSFVNGQVTNGIPFSDLTFTLENRNFDDPVSIRGYEYSNILGNPNLQPEISTDIEIGFDISLFRSRVNADFTYYDRTTEGLILERTIASSSGFTSIWDNIGEIKNTGVELGLNVTPIRLGRTFEWNLGYTFSKNNNKVIELADGLDEIRIAGFTSIYVAALKGSSVSHVKAYGMKTTPDGQTIVNEETGRPLPTENTVDLGSTLHDYTMGFNTTIRFKDISLYALVDYRQGGKFISYSKNSLMWTGKDPLTTYNDRLPFVIPNSVYEDEVGNYQENTVPITTTDLNNYYTGDWNDQNALVLDKTFVKLREVNITYTLPQRFFENIFISNASVSLVGNNLLLWTPSENNVVDPEISTASNGPDSEFGEINGYPSLRTYGFKLNLNF